MSKLTELKSKLAHHVESLRFCEMELSGRKEKLEEIQAEIAAIEAQERKPREFKVGLDENGKPIGVGDTSFGAIMLIPNEKLPRTFIDVIEKLPVKPIVVTMEMAKSLYETGMNSPSEWDKPMTWVVIFRAAGIAAEPSND